MISPTTNNSPVFQSHFLHIIYLNHLGIIQHKLTSECVLTMQTQCMHVDTKPHCAIDGIQDSLR